MGSWFARWFCCESGWRNLSKYNSASVASGSATEDDALIGQASSSSGRSDSKDNHGGIAFLSRGRIKYVKGCWNMGIPIIDPHLVMQQEPSSSSDYIEQEPPPPPATQQRQQLLPQLARILVNKNIFHWNHYLNRGSTPPSSIDLEWEHEVGMLPPLVPDDSGGFELDFEDEEEECEKPGDGRASPSDSAIHRSPSPSSLCHSLEWDSNEFVIQDQPVHQGRLAVIS